MTCCITQMGNNSAVQSGGNTCRPPLIKMSLLKCALLFLILHLYVCHCIASSWTVNIPSTVRALVGSCVVIPCSFDYPPPKNKVRQFTGIWADETGHVIYHPEERKALVQYRNRTKLLGDLHGKDCSLKIDPVQPSDKGPYHFRIEIAEYNNYSYKDNAVSVTTTSDLERVVFFMKEEVRQGDSVSASCSVSHTCPQFPPHFAWSHAGHVQVQHQEIEGALWRTTSTLTFQVGHSDHNKPLKCTVSHRGGIQQTANTVLTVEYAPEIRNTSSCFSDGLHVRCMCFVEANPPSEVRLLSDRELLDTRTERFDLVTIVTVQADLGLFGSVKCIANNTVGNATLLMSLPHSHIYIYIGVSIVAAVVLLSILLLVVARKCSQRRRNNESTIKDNHDLGLRNAQYTVPMRRKCADVHYSDHTYGNEEIFDPEDDAVYANV